MSTEALTPSLIPSQTTFEKESDSVTEVTNKWVRLQAAIDEVSDSLATDMNTVIELIREGKLDDAISTLDEMIAEVGQFTSAEADEDEEEE